MRAWVVRRLLRWTGTYAAGLVLDIDLRFQSSNSVPVERVIVRREEWLTLRALLVHAAMARR